MDAPCKRPPSQGFTLIEMLIVVAIIAVLVAIAIPVFANQVDSAKAATCAANRRGYYAELSIAYLEGGTDSMEQVDGSKYTCPSGGTISWEQDATTGVISVNCSVHGQADATASTTLTDLSNALAASATLKKDGTYYAKSSAGGKQLYDSLSDSEQAILDSFDNWTIKYDTKNKGYRVFFATGDGVYKYDSERNQYQFNPSASIKSDGSMNNGSNNQWGSDAGYGQWADSMDGAYHASY